MDGQPGFLQRCLPHLWLILAAGIAVGFAASIAPNPTPPPHLAGVTGFDFGVVDVPTAWRYASALYEGRWGDVYASTWNQLGPLQLAFSGAVTWFARDVLGYPVGWQLVRGLFNFAYLALLGGLSVWILHLTGPVRRPSRIWVPCVTVAVSSLLVVPDTFYRWGHWTQPVTIGLWMVTVWAVLRGKPWLAGVAVGVSAGFEPWGVFGVILLVLSPTWRSLAKSAAVAVMTSAAVWLPFALQPGFAMGRFQWQVRPDSVWTVLGFDRFGWGARMVQAVLIGVAVAGVLWWLRRRPGFQANRMWLVALAPALLVAARIVTDTIYYPYYTAPLIAVAVALVPVAVARADFWAAALVGAAGYAASTADVNWAAGTCRIRTDVCDIATVTGGWWLSPYLFVGAVFVLLVAAMVLLTGRTAAAADRESDFEQATTPIVST